MRFNRFHWHLLILLTGLFSCEKENNDLPPGNRGDVVEVVEKGKLTKAQIVERIDELDAQDLVEHDVTFYSITYRTQYKGEPIDSRGLMLVPDGVDSAYLLTYLHGTEIPLKLFNIAQKTPSNYDGGTEEFRDVRNMGLGWASAGYTVFMPDYIGYGLTDDEEHPYVYYPEMFISNIDGLLAAKQFINDKGLAYDNRLFITGWSQGGGACMSTHRYIQESYANAFTVVASSGLAGPYNFERFADSFFNNPDEEADVLPIISWAIYSLNKYSDLKRPSDQLYAYPVYDQFAALFPPSSKPGEVFNGFFLSGITAGTDTEFRAAMRNNSFHQGWKPVGKVFLHHGDSDSVVPYYNSVDANAGLTASGGDVTFYTYPGGDHDTELGNFIANTLKDFNALK